VCQTRFFDGLDVPLQSGSPIKMVIADIEAAGVTSLSGIARALQARGIKTRAGKDLWHARQVSRLLEER
jgi:hypothetical protein